MNLNPEPTQPRSISAQARYTGMRLTWTEGAWSGQQAAVDAAVAQTQLGSPLAFIPGFRDVTPDDGPLVYAVATIQSILGPVDWIIPPSDGFDTELVGEHDTEAIY